MSVAFDPASEPVPLGSVLADLFTPRQKMPPREFVAGMVPASQLDDAMDALGQLDGMPSWKTITSGNPAGRAVLESLARTGVLVPTEPGSYKMPTDGGPFLGGAL